jgi:pilus assembly protein CpaF
LTKWTAPGDAAVTSDAEGTTPVDDATSNSSNLPTPFVPPESAAVQDPATQEQSPRRPDVEPRALDPETAEQMAHRAAYDEAARRQAGQKSFSDAAARMNNLAGQDPTIAVELRKMQLTRDITVDAEQRRSFQKLLEPVLAKAQVVSNDPRDVEIIFDLAYDQMLGLGPLGPLWRDDSVTEIMINSYNEIFVSVGGRILDTPFELRSKEALMRMARDLASKVSARTLSAENALVTAELPGARVNFVYGTVTKSGAVITIRKFTKLFGVDKLLEFESLSEEMLEFLRDCVRARANILISGGTNSGKTTIINALSSFIPVNERVITIEDAFELSLSNHHVVPMQTKEKASGDDIIVISQSELMTNALRMAPDRIIIGEVRDDDAALVLMDAANTGHDGTMTTIHANNAYLALNDRLVVMMRSGRNIPDDVARRSVASAVNLVVQVRRIRGRRIISEISVVDSSYVIDGLIQPRTIFTGRLDEEGTPAFTRVGNLGSETDLAQRFDNAEIDITRWRD